MGERGRVRNPTTKKAAASLMTPPPEYYPSPATAKPAGRVTASTYAGARVEVFHEGGWVGATVLVGNTRGSPSLRVQIDGVAAAEGRASIPRSLVRAPTVSRSSYSAVEKKSSSCRSSVTAAEGGRVSVPAAARPVQAASFAIPVVSKNISRSSVTGAEKNPSKNHANSSCAGKKVCSRRSTVAASKGSRASAPTATSPAQAPSAVISKPGRGVDVVSVLPAPVPAPVVPASTSAEPRKRPPQAMESACSKRMRPGPGMGISRAALERLFEELKPLFPEAELDDWQ